MTMLRKLAPLSLIAFVLFAIARTGATAAEAPRLKPVVAVAGDVVRIGDLVDNAGAVADVAIFRSPDAGVTGTLSAKQVLDAIRQYDLLIVDTAGVNAITVSRYARELHPRDIARRVAEALAERYRLADPNMLDINFDREPRALYVDSQAADVWQVERAGYDPRSGRFEIFFTVPGSSSTGPGVRRYAGAITEMAETAVLLRPLNRSEVVMAADIVVERRKKSDLPTDAAATIEDVAGLAVRRALRAGQPVRRADLAKPELVKRDDLVTLYYEVPGIVLTVRGKALASGAEGDTISVLNIQSKRTVQGVVDGRGRVIVAAATPITVTENASARAGRHSE
jgi:flagella basal body P-ring formation protein FlgA